MVHVIALVTRVLGRCLAINAVGLLRSSTNNKISVCGWCKFIPCITSLVIISVSGRRG